MTHYVYLNNFTHELNILNCICDAVINGSRCSSFYTSRSIYCWNHITETDNSEIFPPFYYFQRPKG